MVGLLPSEAAARGYLVEFEGVVNRISGPLEHGSFAVGEGVTGRFTVDSEAEPLPGGEFDPGYGPVASEIVSAYLGAIPSFALTIGDYEATADAGSASLVIANEYVRTPYSNFSRDSFSVETFSAIGAPIAGLRLESMRFQLYESGPVDEPRRLLTTTSIPEALFETVGFEPVPSDDTTHIILGFEDHCEPWYDCRSQMRARVTAVRVTTLPACDDEIDNDGDGRLDFPADPGCRNREDGSEARREDVTIDIEPLLEANPIALESDSPVAVAILGSETVEVEQVEGASLRFHVGEAMPLFDLDRPLVRRLSTVDVNGDEIPDLVAHFSKREAEIAFGDEESCLSGRVDGDRFEACDAILVRSSRCGPGFEVALLPPIAIGWLGRRRRVRSAQDRP